MRKQVYHPLRQLLVDGMEKKGHNAKEVAAAIDRWNDGSQPNSLFERACFQAIQDVFAATQDLFIRGMN